MLPVWALLVVQLGLGAAAALAFGRTRARRWAVLVLGTLALVVPWMLPRDPAIVRALFVLASLLPLLKARQLWSDGRDYRAGFRVWHFLVPVDARQARHGRPRVDGKLLAVVIVYGLVCTGAVIGCVGASALGGPAGSLLRLGAGLVAVYTMVESGASFVRWAHGLAGVWVPPVQRHPAASRNVGEFWSRRWNRPVSEWFRQHCFLPFARRGHPVLGVVATFVVSAVAHAWMVWVATDAVMALLMAAFFLVQAPVVLVERRMGVVRWRPLAAHLWTWLALLVPSPLFVWPYLRVLGV